MNVITEKLDNIEKAIFYSLLSFVSIAQEEYLVADIFSSRFSNSSYFCRMQSTGYVSSPRMSKLLDYFNTRYNYIIIIDHTGNYLHEFIIV